MKSYHGEPISNVDLNEIFRLRDEDHLICGSEAFADAS